MRAGAGVCATGLEKVGFEADIDGYFFYFWVGEGCAPGALFAHAECEGYSEVRSYLVMSVAGNTEGVHPLGNCLAANTSFKNSSILSVSRIS